MNKLSKTTLLLIALIAVFSAGLLFIPSTQANTDLEVEFEDIPLFYNSDIKPGYSVTKWLKVSNNSGEAKPVAIEAINYPEPIPEDDLSRALMVVIQKQGTDLYGGSSSTGPKYLYDFYEDSESQPEIYLSSLNNGETVQYDFTISFPAEKGNEWQGKTTYFDILIGFQGEEAPTPPGPTLGGGGGGWLPPGLTILDESVHAVTTERCEVIITWTTNYFSTTQVIYASEGESHTLDLTDETGTPPKYGYANTTQEYDTEPKVTAHTVTISGLTPYTTYYFRAISHSSPPTISRQYSFATNSCSELYPEEEGVAEEEEEVPEKEAPEEEIPEEEVVIIPEEEYPPFEEEIEEEIEEEEIIEPEEEEEVEEEEVTEVPPSFRSFLSNLLASIGDAFKNFWNICYACLPWWLVLVFALYPLMKVLTVKQEEKREFLSTAKTANKREMMTWLGWLLVLVGLAIYFFFTNYLCVEVRIFLILGLITLFIRSFFFEEKKETGEIIMGAEMPAKKSLSTIIKENFSSVLGLSIILILFIVWLLIKCWPLWLLLVLLVLYFFFSDFFRRRETKKATTQTRITV